MGNIIIGGDLVSSFQSFMIFKPWSGTTSPMTTTTNNSGSLFFDSVTATPVDVRYLDNATHTGLWYHTGVRQTGVSFAFDAHMLWDLRYPMENWFQLYNNTQGFQMIWTIGNQTFDYPNDIGQQYYYCPSVMLEMGATTSDVGSTPPKLISFDCKIKANAPKFFMPSEASTLNDFVTYIRKRNWSF